ncbi:MAG: hemolysin family protein, partial [Oscillospiraceae bacterium]|nr:hemolysin family protein [Oscillospiraceae bacterium]
AITTVLIGTNIVHITVAAIVTVLVTRKWGISAVTAGTLVTTAVVFFVGEMLPKSIAKKYSERFCLQTASSLSFFMLIFTPLSAALTAIGHAVSNLTKGDPEVSVTEDELYDIIEDMTDEGTLDSERGELMSSALQFAELTVETVLTARVDVAAINSEWDCERVLAFIKEQRHSRLPVYEGSIDNIVGVLQIRKYIRAYLKEGASTDLGKLLDEAYFVQRSMKIDELLSVMSQKKLNMAVVTDGYGGTLGIVTVEDILEELVGEIWDEDDVVEESFVPLGGGRFEVDASLTAGEVFDKMDFEPEHEDEELEHKLMGEWAYEQFDRIPKERESFEYEGLSVTVSEMHQNRIVKLVCRVLPEPEEGGGAK